MEREDAEREARGTVITKPDNSIRNIAGGVRNGTNKILDFIRTDPVGYGFLLFGVHIGAEYTQDAQARDSIYKLAIGVSISVFIVLAGSYHIAMQFALKRKLEKKCAVNGYSDQIFMKTTKRWCDRQTARVVTRRLEKLDQYAELSRKNKKGQEFSWLGHF